MYDEIKKSPKTVIVGRKCIIFPAKKSLFEETVSKVYAFSCKKT